LTGPDLTERRLVIAGGREWEIDMDVALFRPNARRTHVAEEFWKSVNVPRS
jgi:hypothetical protein